MLRSIDKRLRRLESALRTNLDKDKEFGLYFILFLLDALGYYLGDPKPNEAPQAATARALGYEREVEFTEALNDGTFFEKYERAKCKLYAKFGMDLETADGHGIADAAKRIYAKLPVSCKASARVKPMHGDIWQCSPLDVGRVGPISRKSRVFTLDVRRHFDRTERSFLSYRGRDRVHRRELRRSWGCGYESDSRRRTKLGNNWPPQAMTDPGTIIAAAWRKKPVSNWEHDTSMGLFDIVVMYDTG